MGTILTKEEIIKQENRLYRAIKESDIAALDELLHDDLLFVTPSGEVITKETDLRTYKEGELWIDELMPDIQGLNIIDDLAVVTLTMGLKGRSNGVPFDVTYRYIRFWKRFGDGTRIVGGSGMAI